METFKKIMKFVIVITCGLWVGDMISVAVSYHADPELYAAQSAPLYAWLLGGSIPYAAMLVVEAIILYIICHMLRREKRGKPKND